MAETTVDSDIQIDGGALFRNIMDAPRGGTPAPSDPGETQQRQDGGSQPDEGEPRVQHVRAYVRKPPNAPQLTEHQRQQAQPEGGELPTGGERPRDPATQGEPGDQPGAAPTGAGAAPGDQGGAAEGQPVPSWRLREEREAREAYATQLREAQETNRQLMAMLQRMQAPPQASPQPVAEIDLPDPVLDPKGYHAAVMNQVTQAIRVTQLDTDLRMAHQRHGEKFEKAYEAFLAVAPNHPDFARSVVNGPTPGERMVQWYERQSMMQEIGSDPRAWMQQQLENALRDPETLQRAIAAANAAAANGGQQPAPRLVNGGRGGGDAPSVSFRLPPTLSRLPSGSPDGATDYAGVSEQDSNHMFRTAMDRKRK